LFTDAGEVLATVVVEKLRLAPLIDKNVFEAIVVIVAQTAPIETPVQPSSVGEPTSLATSLNVPSCIFYRARWFPSPLLMT